VDLIMLVQFAWCIIWLRSKQVHDTLLYAGGVLAAGYVGWMVSDWFTQWFVSPSSPTLLWLEGHLNTDATAVSTLSWMIPPQPVATSSVAPNWVALHVAHSFVFLVLTGAVFTLFVVIVYLRRALWDTPSRLQDNTHSLSSGIVALAASTYLVALTLLLLNDFAWIRDCQWLVKPIQSSWAVAVATHFIAWLPTHAK